MTKFEGIEFFMPYVNKLNPLTYKSRIDIEGSPGVLHNYGTKHVSPITDHWPVIANHIDIHPHLYNLACMFLLCFNIKTRLDRALFRNLKPLIRS